MMQFDITTLVADVCSHRYRIQGSLWVADVCADTCNAIGHVSVVYTYL